MSLRDALLAKADQMELESLRARLRSAEAERDELASEAVDRLMLVATLRTRAEQAEAERDEARAAVRRIHGVTGRDDHGTEGNEACVIDAIVQLQADLSEEISMRERAEAEVARLRGELGAALAEERAAVEAADALQREVAALRLMLREVAQTNASGIDYALRCQRERDEARASWLLWQGKYGDAKRELDELRMGRDAARAEAEEAAAAYNAVAADLRRTAAERDELAAQAVDRLMLVASLRSELATTKRELHRLIHGTAIEGDGACEHEIHADAARAWSRLWHREARRLWREVQGLSGHLDDEQTARTAMLALAHARRRVLETGYGHDALDVARRAVEAVADAMLRGEP